MAPDFMVQAQIADLLANKAGGNVTEEPIYRNLSNAKIGNITLSYRVVVATREGAVFRDAFGRPILWVEGVVVKGRIHKGGRLREVLDEAHQRVEPVYTEYWESDGSAPVQSSSPIIMDMGGWDNPRATFWTKGQKSASHHGGGERNRYYSLFTST
jgi:hypothetical protein